jgi:hypothetical protein
MSPFGKLVAAVMLASTAIVLATPADAGGLFRDRERGRVAAATAATGAIYTDGGRRRCGLFGWFGDRRRDGARGAVAGYTARGDRGERRRWGGAERRAASDRR